MTQEQIQEMHKRFDDRFELESSNCSECSGCMLIDKKDIRYPEFEYDLEKIKTFIESEVDKAVKEERESIARLIDNKIKHIGKPGGFGDGAIRSWGTIDGLEMAKDLLIKQ